MPKRSPAGTTVRQQLADRVQKYSADLRIIDEIEERQRLNEEAFRPLVTNLRERLVAFKQTIESGDRGRRQAKTAADFRQMVGAFMRRVQSFQQSLSQLDDYEKEVGRFIGTVRQFLGSFESSLKLFQERSQRIIDAPPEPEVNPVNPLEIFPRLKHIFFAETDRFAQLVGSFGEAVGQVDFARLTLDERAALLKSYEDLLVSLEALVKSFKDVHDLNRIIVQDPVKAQEDLLKSQEDLIKSYIELINLFKQLLLNPLSTAETIAKSLEDLLESLEDLLKKADDLEARPLIEQEATIQRLEDLITSLGVVEKRAVDRAYRPLREREALLRGLRDLLEQR